jgi:hypothetical protein
MYTDIACVASPCICPPGARAKMPIYSCASPKDPDLIMTERQGVEIDYCPTCRGVWLDRGELDKIIERSSVS